MCYQVLLKRKIKMKVAEVEKQIVFSVLHKDSIKITDMSINKM